MNENNEKYIEDISFIQNDIFRQTNYYARELERIIDKLKIDSSTINLKNINKKDEIEKIGILIKYIMSLKFKDIYTDSQIILKSDALKEKIKIININNHLALKEK